MGPAALDRVPVGVRRQNGDDVPSLEVLLPSQAMQFADGVEPARLLSRGGLVDNREVGLGRVAVVPAVDGVLDLTSNDISSMVVR
ncbi:hypothetical protein ACIQUM_35675 [Amycolatopsis azurea]|uniref:hypothetical protein n=1 Tax=Amycolatopsis azurea TaxID=36819 RepID=UPI00381ADC98